MVFGQVLRKTRAHFLIIHYTVLYNTRNQVSCTGKETNEGLLFFRESTIEQEQKLVKACLLVAAEYLAAMSPCWGKKKLSMEVVERWQEPAGTMSIFAVHVAFVAIIWRL
jgi:hypothetical protein